MRWRSDLQPSVVNVAAHSTGERPNHSSRASLHHCAAFERCLTRAAVVLNTTFPQVALLIAGPLAQRQRVRSALLIAADVRVRTRRVVSGGRRTVPLAERPRLAELATEFQVNVVAVRPAAGRNATRERPFLGPALPGRLPLRASAKLIWSLSEQR